MANGIFNIARGSVMQLIRDNPGSVTLLLLKTAQADSTLAAHQTVSSMLAAANVEADFTGYSRKTGITATLSVGSTSTADMPDQTFANAGGTTNNTISKAIIAVQSGSGDGGLIPLAHYDAVVTTNGSDLEIKLASQGFYSVS